MKSSIVDLQAETSRMEAETSVVESHASASDSDLDIY